MKTLARNKYAFIGASCMSVACLIASFANPLQKLEVYRQFEKGQFNLEYQKIFIITENDENYPYGFNLKKSEKIAQVYRDYKYEKLMILVAAIASSLLALHYGRETCYEVEIENDVTEIKAIGRKQLILEDVKHRLAMASKSQRLLFMDEMKALIEEFGSVEGELMEADEMNATDKFTNASYLLAEGHSLDSVIGQTWQVKVGTPEHEEIKRKFQAWQGDEDSPLEATVSDETSFREQFPESMDDTYWKAICKGLANGLTGEEIVGDILQCKKAQMQTGRAYLEFLKRNRI